MFETNKDFQTCKEQALPSYTQVAKIRKTISHGLAGPRGKREVDHSFETQQGRNEWVGQEGRSKESCSGSVIPVRFESRNRQFTICSRGVLQQLS